MKPRRLAVLIGLGVLILVGGGFLAGTKLSSHKAASANHHLGLAKTSTSTSAVPTSSAPSETATSRPPDRTTQTTAFVPNVTSDDMSTAAQVLENAGFDMSATEEPYPAVGGNVTDASFTMEAVNQNPGVTKPQPIGTTVAVTFAPVLPMPALSGSQEEVATELGDYGFTPSEMTPNLTNPACAPGILISQKPPVGVASRGWCKSRLTRFLSIILRGGCNRLVDHLLIVLSVIGRDQLAPQVL